MFYWVVISERKKCIFVNFAGYWFYHWTKTADHVQAYSLKEIYLKPLTDLIWLAIFFRRQKYLT